MVITPNTDATSWEGSASAPPEAIDAPSAASHTVGRNMPSAVPQNTCRSE
jgi:hypothetical protein